MAITTVVLLILINIYGFLYSVFITKYNFFSNNKIQTKIIGYKTLIGRLPLVLFNISILIILNVIGIMYFDYIFLRDYDSILRTCIEIGFVLLVDDFFFYILHRIMHENKYI